MGTLHKLALVAVLSLLSSCSETIVSDAPATEPAKLDPFANPNASGRTQIVVVSDVHLGADLSYAECNANLARLEQFLEQVRTSPNVKELVIAGDLLDEWFVPATVNTYQGKDQADFVKRITAQNKGVIDAFNRIIQAGQILVTYVPGNHDLTITEASVRSVFPGIHQARDSGLQGLGSYSPAGHGEMIIEHGHRYNFFCAPDPYSNQDIAPGSILPPGYFFTRIAALHVQQDCDTAGDTLPMISPNKAADSGQRNTYVYWKVWKTLMRELPIKNKVLDKVVVTNIDGYTANYSIADLAPFQTTDSGFIDVNLYKGLANRWNDIQTRNQVAVKIPTTRAIAMAAVGAETDTNAMNQYFKNPASDRKIVVFGHSHQAKVLSCVRHDGTKGIYANSGTWIDRNAPTTMNFVVVTPQVTSTPTSKTHVKVFTYQSQTVTQMASDSLRI
ncbi:MAG: metallophosphoesterase [Fibrobacteres bacterium]|nr:metallophosphoesterase [Fibrobacterota bacterium]